MIGNGEVLNSLLTSRIQNLNKYVVSSSDIPDAFSIFKYGRNSIGSTKLDVWDGGATAYIPLQNAEPMNVSSTLAADTLAGTGAQKLLIIGLGAGYVPLFEEIEMDGTNVVQTSGLFLRVYRVKNTQTGSGNINAGDISVIADTETTLQAKILAGNGTTLMAIDTVAVGYNGFIDGIFSSVGEGKTVTVDIFIKQPDGTERIGASFELVGNSQYIPIIPPIKVDEKNDIITRAITGAAGTTVSVFLNQTFIPISWLNGV